MKLTSEEGRMVISDDHEDWELVKDTKEMIEQSRWDLIYEAVFRHKPTQKYYSLWWSEGATEMQESKPFEYEEPELTEVEAREVITTQWVPV